MSYQTSLWRFSDTLRQLTCPPSHPKTLPHLFHAYLQFLQLFFIVGWPYVPTLCMNLPSQCEKSSPFTLRSVLNWMIKMVCFQVVSSSWSLSSVISLCAYSLTAVILKLWYLLWQKDSKVYSANRGSSQSSVCPPQSFLKFLAEKRAV